MTQRRTVFIAVVFVIVIVMAIVVYKPKLIELLEQKKQPAITCIMVTGKDRSREPLARQAIQNFMQQVWHGPKKLLIINHGHFKLSNASDVNVEELHVEKTPPHATLGALRNLALDRVAPGGLWAVWDDDDHRRPDYLQLLYRAMTDTNADLVSYTDRIEYNANTGLVWRVHVPWGCVHVLARRMPHIQYIANRDTLEDEFLIRDYQKASLRVHIIDTSKDASLYLRLVHSGANTSPYVDFKKTTLIVGKPGDYQEMPATLAERAYVAEWLNNGGAATLVESARLTAT